MVEQKAVVELKYKFIPDIETLSQTDEGANNTLSEEDGPVTITFGKATGPINVFSDTLDSTISSESGTTLGSSETGYIKVIDGNDSENYRTIRFTTNVPSSEDKAVQTIHIEGKIDDYKKISRDVTYYLMEHQDMTVTCIADEPSPYFAENAVENIAGEGVNVSIKIPELLPESMFPLIFNIESSKLSITPNTTKYSSENLPVESGYSICTGKESKKTFHYVYTLSYADYNSIEADANGGKTFTCHFKTNMDESASDIYVANEYFNTGSAPFANYSLYSFSNLRFSTRSAAANSNVNFTFTLDEDDSANSRTISVVLDGLTPQNNSGLSTIDADTGTYTYTYTAANGVAGASITLPLKTLPSGQHNGNYSVALSAFEGSTPIYHDAELDNTSLPSSFTIPAEALIVEGGSTLYIYADSSLSSTIATSSIESTGDWWAATYYNEESITINLSNFTNPTYNTLVYFSCAVNNWYGTTTYYASATIEALMEATADDPLTLNFSTTAP